MNKEAIELLEKAKDGGPATMILIDQALAKLQEQPLAGDFTKEMRLTYELRPKVIEGKIVAKHIFDLCYRLDRSEAENKALRRPLEAAGFKVDGMLAVGRELIKQSMQVKELEASRKELLTALEELAATFVGLPEGSIGGQAMKKANDAIKSNKEISGKK